MVEAIFKATVEGLKTLQEIYACHRKAINSMILDSPPAGITIADWVQAQKVNPTISQVFSWMKSKKLDTVKVGDEMSH